MTNDNPNHDLEDHLRQVVDPKESESKSDKAFTGQQSRPVFWYWPPWSADVLIIYKMESWR